MPRDRLTIGRHSRDIAIKHHADDPAIYRAASEALGVAPDACVFVGDGNASELDGARAVGMRAVRIERPFSLAAYRKAESRTFDASIGDLRRLADLLPPPSAR